MAMHLVQGAIYTRRTSRAIIAESYFGKISVPTNFALTNAERHTRAAMALVEKMAGEWCRKNGQPEWINAPQCGRWVGGESLKGDGYVFTYAGETNALSCIEPRGFIQNCEGNGKPQT